jgi:hypothetical protein
MSLAAKALNINVLASREVSSYVFAEKNSGSFIFSCFALPGTIAAGSVFALVYT